MLAAFTFALGIRTLRFEVAFPGDGTVQFTSDDAAYHARRALYSFVNFPSVLDFDPYIAHPDGAPVPWPPLYDWALGGVARLFGRSTDTFERVAVWASPVLSALTVVPVFAMGRRLGGVGVGLGAAWLFALLPASSNRTGVGNPDHHAAVALLAACWLASLLAEALAEDRARRSALRVGAHGAVVAAMLLVWNGSLLYLLMAEGARLLASAVVGRHPDRLLRQCASALLAATLVVPWVAWAEEPVGGAFATTTISWMHVVVLGALAGLAAALAALERLRPEPLARRRALRAGGLTLAIALPLLCVEGLREPLGVGTGFLAKQDVWAVENIEQQPLFAAPVGRLPATRLFGWYAFLVPLSPLLVVLRARRGCPPEAMTILLAWTTVFGLLTMGQIRYAMDFAVVGAVVFAWALGGAREWLAPRVPWKGRLTTVAAVAVGLLLLWPALTLHGFRLGRALARVGGSAPAAGAQGSAQAGLLRFAAMVRSATPETAGFLEAGGRPEYGLLVPPDLGHDFVYTARRAVPAGNFGPYLDEEKFDQTSRFFYEAKSEAEAVAIAERLRTPFVVSALEVPHGSQPGAFLALLHQHDGSASGGRIHSERFRIVTEGPTAVALAPRRPLERLGRWQIPYKLYELVAGAVLEGQGPPGATLVAEVEIATPLGRRFLYRAASRMDASGRARVRVPYATDADAPARATGPYRVSIGNAAFQLHVPEAAVRAGATLAIGGPGR